MPTKSGLALPKDFRQGKTMWQIKTIINSMTNVNEVQLPVAVRILTACKTRRMHGEVFEDYFCYRHPKYGICSRTYPDIFFPTDVELDEREWYFTTQKAAVKFARRLMFVEGYESSVHLSWVLARNWQGPGSYAPFKIIWTETRPSKMLDFFDMWTKHLTGGMGIVNGPFYDTEGTHSYTPPPTWDDYNKAALKETAEKMGIDPKVLHSISLQESASSIRNKRAGAMGQYVLSIDPGGAENDTTMALRAMLDKDGNLTLLSFDEVCAGNQDNTKTVISFNQKEEQ